ncbi:DNA ATP-dependent helicase [Spathaspora passalidarum NRRL Y-27907]|uniref:Chromatin-remodeling ATPase INO80 n=1 Tax=Spathaspora passalidarum (strain NRRL Y-27907 / 11-Y1) TaxID=619300 RepID=G3AHK5_SPAPN|nr:DNA ATP-dependent helicase [Spathaspora passalidarum NRRL Y-27907]EGW34169.1 DNA ATP-dependent helicase [Spathaspora passalidarum NRRL Y-27907]
MNISSMLSNDSTVPTPTTQSPLHVTTDQTPIPTTSLLQGNNTVPNPSSTVANLVPVSAASTGTENGHGQHLSREDSIVSDIISTHNYNNNDTYDVAYKTKFESNFNILNQLDQYQQLSHNLKLLKFDEIKLNNFIINTNKFTSNYIDRVIAEDISSRNNKISDTNKSKELQLIDYSKPLHHNTTRGKEFKWGSTREVHKVESKKKRRVASSSTTAASPNGSSGPVLIKPKLGDNVAVRRSTRPKPKRKLPVEEQTEEEEDHHKKVKLEQDGKLKIKLSVKKPEPVNVNSKEYKAFLRQYDNTCIAIWKDMSRKDGPKVSRLMQQSTQAKLINLKKTSILAAREAKRWQLKNNKNQKDLTTKARRAMREMFNFWKRNERIERELRKKYEKELLDKAKREEEEREAKRQSRKLNFLITQTELYSHFIGKKIKTDEIEGSDSDPNLVKHDKSHLDKYTDIESKSHDINTLDFENEDDDALHRAAAQNAQNALELAQSRAKEFNDEPLKNPDTNGEEMNFQNPTLLGDITIPQPKMLTCTLKEYQIKGLNWLANLYEQGINGILADEMGLGKTVQSISVLSYLAETHNIWGPFLVVTPASTLHNWQQEISRFVPNFKVLPYWGNAKDRKILRKFWDRKSLRYTKDSPFHVLVTSYQLVVADAAYFQKMKWQYMILDEAQAIKSSQSSRWKSLLSFSCRNRLLLTGTPIQNSMQELWALLHFIMPSLFDSHDEFSDWFSKDIESHAQSNTSLDEQQLRRLHVILKPFMLRRIKKNVQSELGDKKEIDIICDLTNRQQKYYQMLRSQISIMDLLDSSSLNSSSSDDATSLINLVMQFRKVCNHPDLFERADVKSPFSFGKFAETSSFLRETNELEMSYTTENVVSYNLPKLIYDELLTPNEKTDSKDSIYEMFNIYKPEHVKDNQQFGWLKSIDVSPQELNTYTRRHIVERAIDLQEYTDINYSKVSRFNYLYEGEFVPNNKKLLITQYENKFSNITNSSILSKLYSIQDHVYEDMFINVISPAAEPLASAPPITSVCSSRNFYYKTQDVLFNPKIRSSLLPLPLSQEYQLMTENTPLESYPKSNMLPSPVNKKIDYSNIRMPSMNRFITESGKLAKLDELLVELKQEGHRVLIYFQMTRMMDLMEEYLTYRQHKYIRLDGSSKLDDRRDLVHDWQTKPELFIFLLSTRAGGLGINLTAADTVIFYDSDWNPTIDSQAMDRAHRLGQTKQVTVYRLLTRGTIEERMRDRAKQKEQVQQVVMEGKATITKKEEHINKKKDVAFLLLGDSPSDVSSGKTSTTSTPEPESANGKKKYRVSADDALSSKKLQELYHEGEGEFSGNVTPAP